MPGLAFVGKRFYCFPRTDPENEMASSAKIMHLCNSNNGSMHSFQYCRFFPDSSPHYVAWPHRFISFSTNQCYHILHSNLFVKHKFHILMATRNKSNIS